MEWILTGIAIAGCGAAMLIFWRSRVLYRRIDRMLDEVLDGRMVTMSDLREGKASALANKAKRIQEKLAYEVEQAEKEKEQVKSLISNMSHQLKTPLANVMMYGEIMESDKLDKQKREEFLKKLHSQCVKIEWILQSLFKMVKLEQGVISFEAENLSVKETLLDAISTIYDKAEKKQIAIITEEFPDCLLFHNRKWTAEVFANLLENAVKYTGKGGTITIRVQRFELYTQISVIDNGIGIRNRELTEIFKRFYRSKEVENMEGSGIGLYLSKLILEQESGYLNVESVYGKGSCFSVFLQNCKN